MKPRSGETVLDWLEAEGVISNFWARSSRAVYLKWRDSELIEHVEGEKYKCLVTGFDRWTMVQLLAALHLPPSANARWILKRNESIASHHAYLRCIGERSPTSRVAERWGVSVATVKYAVKYCTPYNEPPIEPTNHSSTAGCSAMDEIFENLIAKYGQPNAKRRCRVVDGKAYKMRGSEKVKH